MCIQMHSCLVKKPLYGLCRVRITKERAVVALEEQTGIRFLPGISGIHFLKFPRSRFSMSFVKSWRPLAQARELSSIQHEYE